jgi:hypothetical protein
MRDMDPDLAVHVHLDRVTPIDVHRLADAVSLQIGEDYAVILYLDVPAVAQLEAALDAARVLLSGPAPRPSRPRKATN